MLLHSCSSDLAKVVSIYLNIPQIKIITIASEPHKIHFNLKFVKPSKLKNFAKRICNNILQVSTLLLNHVQ